MTTENKPNPENRGEEEEGKAPQPNPAKSEVGGRTSVPQDKDAPNTSVPQDNA